MAEKARYTITPVPTPGVNIPQGPGALRAVIDIVAGILGGVTYVRELNVGVVLNNELVLAVIPQVVNISAVRSEDDEAMLQVTLAIQELVAVPIYVEIDHVLDSHLQPAPTMPSLPPTGVGPGRP